MGKQRIYRADEIAAAMRLIWHWSKDGAPAPVKEKPIKKKGGK